MSRSAPDDRQAVPPTRWERMWSVFDRWTPHVLLLTSTAASVGAPGQPAASRLVKLALAAVAAAWVVHWHTLDPSRVRDRAGAARGYFAGLLALAALLMATDLVFFVFAITGFLHAHVLRPPPLVFVGTGATSFAILYLTWGGFPQATWEETVGFLSILLIQTFLIGLGIVGSERLHQLNEERRRTVRELETMITENEGLHAQLVAQAREAGIHDERQRMAREIHDTLAQGLTGVVAQLEAAAASESDPPTLRRHLDAAAAPARDSLTEARRSVQALGPGALRRGRLSDALDELARDWSELTGIRAEVTATGSAAPLPAELEVELLRVAQEALANVARHAAASRVGVALSHLDDTVTLDVRGYGVGFDPDTIDADGGFGLTSMRQRVARLGGTLAIESRPAAGTAVSATVPATVPERRHV